MSSGWLSVDIVCRLPLRKRQALDSSDLKLEADQARAQDEHTASLASLASLTYSDQQPGSADMPHQQHADPPQADRSAGAAGPFSQPNMATSLSACQQVTKQPPGSLLVGQDADSPAPAATGTGGLSGLSACPAPSSGQAQANAAALLAASKPALLPEEDDYDADE